MDAKEQRRLLKDLALSLEHGYFRPEVLEQLGIKDIEEPGELIYDFRQNLKKYSDWLASDGSCYGPNPATYLIMDGVDDDQG